MRLFAACLAVTAVALGVWVPDAPAGWGPARHAERFSAPPRPPAEVRIVAPERRRPLRVSVRGRAAQAVPQSGGAEQFDGALSSDGTVVVVFVATNCGEPRGGPGALCESRVALAAWRPGDPVPAPRVVSLPRMGADRPEVEVGDDGTVLVTWTTDAVEQVGGKSILDAAVGPAPGSLTPVRLAADGARSLGLQLVRGRPQLAYARGPAIRLVEARRGRIHRDWVEASVRVPGERDVRLLRSASGHRVLAWGLRDDVLRVRTGAAGRRLGSRPLRFRAAGASVALGDGGDVVMASRPRRRLRQRIRLARWRAGGRRVLRQALAPVGGVRYPFDLGAAVAVDRRGRAYVAWTTGAGRDPRRGNRLGVAGASAARGRPFGRGRRLTRGHLRGACFVDGLAVLAPGRAVAQYTCRESAHDLDSALTRRRVFTAARASR